MSDAYDPRADAKRLLRIIRSGGLATLTSDGHPCASLVAVATMPDGRPILLLSRLAAHTQHLFQNGRCSLLLSEGGRGDPLAHARLTLVGHAVRAEAQTAQATARFLARNPKSKLYAGFPDFGFWLLNIETAHLNGGFARAASFEASELLTTVDQAEDLLAGEESALAHMNADHRDAVALYATRLAGQAEGDWRVSGLDPDGMDLASGDRVARIAFDPPVQTLSALRQRLVALAASARSQES